jgi:hypothetical protein
MYKYVLLGNIFLIQTDLFSQATSPSASAKTSGNKDTSQLFHQSPISHSHIKIPEIIP